MELKELDCLNNCTEKDQDHIAQHFIQSAQLPLTLFMVEAKRVLSCPLAIIICQELLKLRLADIQSLQQLLAILIALMMMTLLLDTEE